MSSAPPPPDPPPPPPAQPPAPPEFDIPNAEKYMLEADVMRRRQLRSALLHGSHRTWREHRKVWPGVIAGLVAAALFIAITAVKSAYDKDQAATEEDEQVVFCDALIDAEDTVLAGTLGDVDPDDPESVDAAIDEAEGVARSLSEAVPGHLEEEVGKDVDTVYNTFSGIADDEGEPDVLLAQEKYLEASGRLLRFIDDTCES